MFTNNKKSLKIPKGGNQKDGQENGQRERTNDDLQNITQKTEDRETKTPLRSGYELVCSGRLGSYCTS